jgi:hypothetical protein
MQTIKHPQTADRFIAEGRRIRDFLKLFPQGVRHLLLVIDPADEAELILEMALRLAERWQPQITLVHGGRLREAAPAMRKSDRDDLVDLICLGWDLKNRYADVCISRIITGSRRQILAEAAERKADVIIVPEALAAGFQWSTSSESESIKMGLPCPMVILMEVETEWANGASILKCPDR